MEKGLGEMHEHSKMGSKCRAEIQGETVGNSRQPRYPAGIIFNPLCLVCIAGEAARVLPHGAQLS